VGFSFKEHKKNGIISNGRCQKGGQKEYTYTHSIRIVLFMRWTTEGIHASIVDMSM